MALIQPTIHLTDDEVARFHTDGFLTIPQISTTEEIDKLREIFARLFQDRAGRAEGAHFDMMTHDDEDAASVLPAIINPVNFATELRSTLFRANATAIAEQLLGSAVTASFEHAILKPANHGAATPWHQDEATRVDDGFEYEQLSIWMPLQFATSENGCIQYIPGTHKEDVLPHRSPKSDPRIHAIECAGGFDPARAVPCSLPPGGAAIHHGRTLHCAGPNHSATPRCAYILAFELPPVRTNRVRNFHWNREKDTANLIRRRNWRQRGGVLLELARKLRGGMWRDPHRLLFEAQRACRALLNRRGHQ